MRMTVPHYSGHWTPYSPASHLVPALQGPGSLGGPALVPLGSSAGSFHALFQAHITPKLVQLHSSPPRQLCLALCCLGCSVCCVPGRCSTLVLQERGSQQSEAQHLGSVLGCSCSGARLSMQGTEQAFDDRMAEDASVCSSSVQ